LASLNSKRCRTPITSEGKADIWNIEHGGMKERRKEKE
jgi:hypothetical protein